MANFEFIKLPESFSLKTILIKREGRERLEGYLH